MVWFGLVQSLSFYISALLTYSHTGAECSPENRFIHEAPLVCSSLAASRSIRASWCLMFHLSTRSPRSFSKLLSGSSITKGNLKNDFFKRMFWCETSASCIEENTWIFYAYTQDTPGFMPKLKVLLCIPWPKAIKNPEGNIQYNRNWQYPRVCWPSTPGQCDETSFSSGHNHLFLWSSILWELCIYTKVLETHCNANQSMSK